ncbi:MAG: energy transducer TonB [Erythrobacter sp.]|nr:energy transducer TonB [Erythrobacter sp.]
MYALLMIAAPVIASALAGPPIAEPPAAAEPPADSPDQAQGILLPIQGASLYSVAPLVEYPSAALRYGIEGRCMVALTLDQDGVPQDIRPDCTHPIFREAARKGVAMARIKIGSGIEAGGRFRIPMSFHLSWE